MTTVRSDQLNRVLKSAADSTNPNALQQLLTQCSDLILPDGKKVTEVSWLEHACHEIDYTIYNTVIRYINEVENTNEIKSELKRIIKILQEKVDTNNASIIECKKLIAGEKSAIPEGTHMKLYHMKSENKTYPRRINELNDMIARLDKKRPAKLLPEWSDNITSKNSSNRIKTYNNKSSYATTSSTSLFSPTEFIQKNKDAKQLLECVLRCEYDNAKAIYSEHPELLFVESSAKDYAAGLDAENNDVHRIITQSPFEAALASGNKYFYNDMARYFDRIVDEKSGKNGYQIAEELLQKQFPNGFAYPESTYDFNSLYNRAIVLKPKNERIHPLDDYNILEEPIAEFKQSFLPNETKIGHHFNLNDLIKAIEQIDGYYNAQWFHGNIGLQVDLFLSNQVIGYLERFLSKYDADILTQGSGNISITPPTVLLPGSRIEYQGVKPNSQLNWTKPLSVFPLDQTPHFRLGINGHFFAMAKTSDVRNYCISFSSSISLMVSNNLRDLKKPLELLRSDKIASLKQFRNWLHTKTHAAQQEQQIDIAKTVIKMN